MEVNLNEIIATTNINLPHVVILGAGASIAACPRGDKNGKILPSMGNLSEVVGMQDLLASTGIESQGNFEEVYSHLAYDSSHHETVDELDRIIYDYFDTLDLPETPNLYDHLICSLRGKDLIATFNWDPLLCIAYLRNEPFLSKMPNIVFLHGNVQVAYCPIHDDVIGITSLNCPHCHKRLTPTRLLYPIAQKDYDSDGFIRRQWDFLSQYINNAYLITFFGYSGPASDTRALDIMGQAYKANKLRNRLQTEIINTAPEEDLKQTWEPFFFSHHYNIYSSFYESWAGSFPRRSCEALSIQIDEARFLPRNSGFYQDPEMTFEALRRQLGPYLEAEG